MYFDIKDNRTPLKENTDHFVALKKLFPRNVEGILAERPGSGKIVLFNPLSESNDDAADGLARRQQDASS